jgi:uncharacterized protein
LNIVLDTNVLVSGLLNPHGPPGQIVRLVAAGEIVLCHDARIMDEYRRILQHEKFQFDEALAENLLDEIKASGIPLAAKPLGFTLLDPEDEKFLEVAIAGRVACLVTGNSRHFTMPKSVNVKIIKPADFILLIAGKPG